MSDSGPTIEDLEDKIACEVALAYWKNVNKPVEAAELPASAADSRRLRRRRLYQNHYYASVSLSLSVTRSGGFNPSYSKITPLKAAGSAFPAAPADPTAPAVSAPVATYNRTLAVSAQATAATDYKIVENYAVDVHQLVDRFLYVGNGPLGESPAFPICGRKSINDHPSQSTLELRSPLKGVMNLEETIDDGLAAIDRTKSYNVSGDAVEPLPLQVDPSGGDTPIPERPKKLFDSAAPGQLRIQSIGPFGPFASVTQAPAGIVSAIEPYPEIAGGGGYSATTFGSTVDFNITLAGGLGPSLALLTSKWNTVGTNPLLNGSRATQDSMSITFGPTCRDGRDTTRLLSVTYDPNHIDAHDGPTAVPHKQDEDKTKPKPKPKPNEPEPIPPGALIFCGVFDESNASETELARTACLHPLNPVQGEFTFTVSVARNDAGSENDKDKKDKDKDKGKKDKDEGKGTILSLAANPAPGILVRVQPPTSDAPQLSPGDIAWTGYLRSGGPVILYNLRGQVTNVFGDPLGQILLQGYWESPALLAGDAVSFASESSTGSAKPKQWYYLSAEMLDLLDGMHYVKDYWDTVPRCDALSAGQKQGAISGVNSQNQLQRLQGRRE